MVVVVSVMFGVPMPNPSSDLADKVETTLLSEVSEIADQVCDGMLVTRAAVLSGKPRWHRQTVWEIEGNDGSRIGRQDIVEMVRQRRWELTAKPSQKY